MLIGLPAVLVSVAATGMLRCPPGRVGGSTVIEASRWLARRSKLTAIAPR